MVLGFRALGLRALRPFGLLRFRVCLFDEGAVL